MANLLSVCCGPWVKQRLRDEIDAKHREAEISRKRAYRAAARIQSWWRGVLTRGYLRFLAECCVIIQSVWRGHRCRRLYRKKLQLTVDLMHFMHYYNAAAKIQALWRGYKSRRDLADFQGRKNYLAGITATGEIFRMDTINTAIAQVEWEHKQEMARRKDEILTQARQHHFMASTESKPGVYNGPNRSDAAELIERTMHGLSHTLKPSQEWHRRLEEHYYTVNQRLPSDQQDTSSSGVGKWTARFATWPRTEGVAGSTIPTLPPIESAEVQGPFRPNGVVKAQKSRPLNLSVQASSDFGSVRKARNEEAHAQVTKRIQPSKFKPTGHINHPLVSLIHTKSPAKRIEYGTVHFRSTVNNAPLSAEKGFELHTLQKKIPHFDQFNKSYL